MCTREAETSKYSLISRVLISIWRLNHLKTWFFWLSLESLWHSGPTIKYVSNYGGGKGHQNIDRSDASGRGYLDCCRQIFLTKIFSFKALTYFFLKKWNLGNWLKLMMILKKKAFSKKMYLYCGLCIDWKLRK